MPDRFCSCGVKMSPRMPRVRDRNGELVCPMCAQNQPRTAARDSHPDLDVKRALFGTANTSLGRAGFARHRTAMITDFAFHDPKGWEMGDSVIQPVRHAIEGARAFANERGLRDPHAHDFSKVMQSKDRVAAIGQHYDNMPEFDKSAVPHFHAMRDEVAKQHDFATKRMGIKYESVDHDPYPDVHSMVKDVNDNKRLKVMSTKVTGSHPLFTDEENDKFRFVHDLFGHAATGRDFSRHGEEAAFQAHSMMFSHHARPAMAAETRGQNSSVILNGDFGAQKIGVLPQHMHEDSSIDFHPRVGVRLTQRPAGRFSAKQVLMHTIAATRPSIVIVAHDSGDGETLFHCPFCGSGQIVARNDGAVDCDFCHTAFTVQVQPQMPAFPQTINGVPIDVPGMPKGGEGADVPPDEASAAGYPPDEGGSDPDDPMATGPDSTGDEGAPTPEEGDDESAPPPFAKNSLLHTTAGQQVSPEGLMAWLALSHTSDRSTTLARARRYQRS